MISWCYHRRGHRPVQQVEEAIWTLSAIEVSVQSVESEVCVSVVHSVISCLVPAGYCWNSSRNPVCCNIILQSCATGEQRLVEADVLKCYGENKFAFMMCFRQEFICLLRWTDNEGWHKKIVTLLSIADSQTSFTTESRVCFSRLYIWKDKIIRPCWAC